MRPRRYSKRRSIKKNHYRTKVAGNKVLKTKKRYLKEEDNEQVDKLSLHNQHQVQQFHLVQFHLSSLCRGPSVDNDGLAMQAHHPTDTTTPALNNINNYHLVNDRIDLQSSSNFLYLF